MRFNMPFGRVGAEEFGTYYIAYARTSELIEQMLTNMFIGDPPGNTDRILDFSTAVTGSLFFVPSGRAAGEPHAGRRAGLPRRRRPDAGRAGAPGDRRWVPRHRQPARAGRLTPAGSRLVSGC